MNAEIPVDSRFPVQEFLIEFVKLDEHKHYLHKFEGLQTFTGSIDL